GGVQGRDPLEVEEDLGLAFAERLRDRVVRGRARGDREFPVEIEDEHVALSPSLDLHASLSFFDPRLALGRRAVRAYAARAGVPSGDRASARNAARECRLSEIGDLRHRDRLEALVMQKRAVPPKTGLTPQVARDDRVALARGGGALRIGGAEERDGRHAER